MSAAEPAPIPHTVNGVRRAPVIDITTRKSRRPGRELRAMTDTPPAGPGSGETGAGRAELAEHVETTFTDYQLTLTDEDTRRAYTVSLGIAQNVMRAACASGVVDEAQQDELVALLEELKTVPDRLG